jgi:hypothetical protein
VWSYVLSLLGVLGLLLVEVRPRVGWWVTLVDEWVWVAYALVTQQYGFILSACVYEVIAVWRLSQPPRKIKSCCTHCTHSVTC